MRERKYIKFRVDMHDDTKFKIIDRKPERDLMHYVWTRLVILAGKVNLEGDLYMSKNLPYTVETLAIEFNRDSDQIKSALDVFIELEMVELTEDKIYRVKNFAKHQNIKVKEKIKCKEKEADVKKKEAAIKEASKSEIYDNKNVEVENKISKNDTAAVKNDDKGNIEIPSSSINKIDNMSNKKTNNNSTDNIIMLLENNKNKKVNKNKKKGKSSDINDEEVVEDNEIVCFYDSGEERPLGKCENVVSAWSF